MKRESFEKARWRRSVDGEYSVGSQPAWLESDLRKWFLSKPSRKEGDPVPWED